MQAQSRRGRSSSAPFLFTEELESRTLLSWTMQDGVLLITGTDADDVITISLDASDSNLLVVTDNDVPSFFNKHDLAFDVHAIVMQGLDGNDDLEVDESNGRINFAVQATGDAGDDTIVGGSGNDFLAGKDG